MGQLARIKEEMFDAATDRRAFDLFFIDLMGLWSRLEYLIAFGEEALAELPPDARYGIEDRTDARILSNRAAMREQQQVAT